MDLTNLVFIDGSSSTKHNNSKQSSKKEKWTTVPPKAFEPWTKKRNGKTYHYCQHCKYWTLHQPGIGKNCQKMADPLTDLLQSFGGGNNASVRNSWAANQSEDSRGGFFTKGTSGFGSLTRTEPSIFDQSRSYFGNEGSLPYGGGQKSSPFSSTGPPFGGGNSVGKGQGFPSSSPRGDFSFGPTHGFTEKKMIGSAAFGSTSERTGPVFGSSSGSAIKPSGCSAEQSSGGLTFGSCATTMKSSTPFGRSDYTFQRNSKDQNSSREGNSFNFSVPAQPNLFSFSAPKKTQTFGAAAAPLFGSPGATSGIQSQQRVAFHFRPNEDQNSSRGTNSFNLSASGQSNSYSFSAPPAGPLFGSPAKLSGPQSTQQNSSSFRFPTSEQRQNVPAQGAPQLTPLGSHTSPFVADQKSVQRQAPSTVQPPSFQPKASDGKQSNLFQTEASSRFWPPSDSSTPPQPLFSTPVATLPASQPAPVPQVVTPPPVPALLVPAVVGPSEMLSIQIKSLDAKRKAMEKYLVR